MTPREPETIQDIEPEYGNEMEVVDDPQEMTDNTEQEEEAQDAFWNLLILLQTWEYVGLLDTG
jgi:hypothetical protein